MKRRLNIGLIIDDIENSFTNQAATGAEIAAKEIDANLFLFPGHYIGETGSRYIDARYEYQFNSIFSLPTERNVDILFVLQGLVCTMADEQTQRDFLKSLPNVPIVCLFTDFEDYHSVTYNNRSGIRESVLHFVEKHNAKDIGFISGPLTNRDACERLDAFKAALEECGIEVDEGKIAYGDFSTDSEVAINTLLERNGHLDAIVFANDSMAVGGYSVLSKRGIIPGKDILVSGFDDDVFAVSLEPPLTTVEARAASLAYTAVLNAEKYINGTAPKEIKVDTNFIQRNSCGCDDIDTKILFERLKINGNDIDSHELSSAIAKYLFYIRSEAGVGFETLYNFIDEYVAFLKLDDMASGIPALNARFSSLLRSELVVMANREKFFNVLQTLQSKAYEYASDDKECVAISEAFSKFYRRFAFSGVLPADSARRRTERMRRVINRRMSEVFLSDTEENTPYDRLIKGMADIGLPRSLLYLFQGNVRGRDGYKMKLPTSLLLKAVSDKDGSRTLPEEQQLLRTECIFENEFITGDERRTMIVSPLFVGEDMYGLLVNELQIENAFSVASVIFQLSASIRALHMKHEQNKIKRDLQNSLERFIQDNSKLEEIALKDELTGLFNRRGFVTNAEKIFGDPLNHEKIAVLCYADMDNLKMVNDKFGHDEGDFALRTLAHVLNESFRESDIIGRIGGDEFVALAITGVEVDIVAMKERIESVTSRYNKDSGKPYPIEMSIGLYKFRITRSSDVFEVMNEADLLLYQEKLRRKAGRSFNG